VSRISLTGILFRSSSTTKISEEKPQMLLSEEEKVSVAFVNALFYSDYRLYFISCGASSYCSSRLQVFGNSLAI
jgi:hypothetical protein